jgi:hypothetical protein
MPGYSLCQTAGLGVPESPVLGVGDLAWRASEDGVPGPGPS